MTTLRATTAIVALALAILTSVSRADDVKPNDDSMGAKAPQGATTLVGGDDLSAWVHKNGKDASWTYNDQVMTVKPRSGDIKTKAEFKSFQLHAEFNCPNLPPNVTGQGRGNSGIYMQGVYELQVLDSYGLKLQDNDCGAIYKQIIPAHNVCKKPEEWQTYDVTFTSAVVEGGKTVKKARITVIHNGVKTIDDKEINPTPGGVSMDEGKAGPILLQDHGNLVKFRNIWIKPID